MPDLWMSRRASPNESWATPVNLGPGVNTPRFEGSIAVTSDGRTAYFAAMDSSAVFRLFVSTRSSPGDPFGSRTVLGPPMNLDGHAYGPALTGDERTMVFASGAGDPFAPGALHRLFVTTRRGSTDRWSTPIALESIDCPTCFAGLPTVTADGRLLCWMGDRGDSFGDKDIYCAQRR
jgi:hypothetical protein